MKLQTGFYLSSTTLRALTFAAGFGLVPGSFFGAAQCALACWLHQVTRVAVVDHGVVVREVVSNIDAIGYWSGVPTADD